MVHLQLSLVEKYTKIIITRGSIAKKFTLSVGTYLVSHKNVYS